MMGNKGDKRVLVNTGKQPISSQFGWLDIIKGLALFGVFFHHVVERIFGWLEVGDISNAAPPIVEQLAQLRPLTKYGIWNIPINLLRWGGWFGDHGVELFLIVSGFGLTWGLLAHYGKASIPLRDFYLRRAERIYPLWWGTHLFFMAFWLLTGLGLSMTDPRTYLSLVGIRFTPGLLFYFSAAWWYVGLLLQLYLIYPLLWEAMRRWGPLKLLVVSCALAFAARVIGTLIFKNYLQTWLAGGIFITRLPEFVLGISLAAWMYRDPQLTSARLRAPTTVILAFAACVLSFPLALTLLGMSVVPFLVGAGLFVLLYAVLARAERWGKGTRALRWAGRHSYSLYLVHHPLIMFVIPGGLAKFGTRELISMLLVILLMVVGAVALERAVNLIMSALGRWKKSVGKLRVAVRVGAILAAIFIVLVGAELLVRRLDPQEAFGAGERPSLEPDPVLGWRLKPSQTIRLRWGSYDYVVSSNSLGFPGPEYPEHKEPGVIRIMTVGDAFTSAEGVNTDQAWPRLLETDLAHKLSGHRVEVLNFGITGYGPIQYSLVFKRYAPIYKPDLLIIGFFVNDYQDVLINPERSRDTIGFDLPSQDGWQSISQLAQLRIFIKFQLLQPFMELIQGKPRDYGYFLGNFSALEKARTDINLTGRQLVKERLQEIKDIAEMTGTKVMIAMIPAPVQVCKPRQLAYFPRPVDLNDSTRFDLEQPQKMTQAIANALSFKYYDLRPVLSSSTGSCFYQSKNMHWTVQGHQAVADYLAKVLISDSIIVSR